MKHCMDKHNLFYTHIKFMTIFLFSPYSSFFLVYLEQSLLAQFQKFTDTFYFRSSVTIVLFLSVTANASQIMAPVFINFNVQAGIILHHSCKTSLKSNTKFPFKTVYFLVVRALTTSSYIVCDYTPVDIQTCGVYMYCIYSIYTYISIQYIYLFLME